jgi:signal transduction histidine kinase
MLINDDQKILNVIDKHNITSTLYENNFWVVELKQNENLLPLDLAEIYSDAIDLTLQNNFTQGWKTCLVIDSFSEIQWSKLMVPGSFILQKGYDALAIVSHSQDGKSSLAHLILNTFSSYIHMKIFTNEAEALVWLEKQVSSKKNWTQIKENFHSYVYSKNFREKIAGHFSFIIPILAFCYGLTFAYFGLYLLTAMACTLGSSLTLTKWAFRNKKGSHSKYIYFISSFAAVCLGFLAITGGPQLTYVSNLLWLEPLIDLSCFSISAWTLIKYFQFERNLKNNLLHFKNQSHSDTSLVLDRLQRFSQMNLSPLDSEKPTLQTFRWIHNSIDHLAESLKAKSLSYDFLDSVINKLYVGVVIVDDHQRINFCNEKFLMMCDSVSPIYKELSEILKTEPQEIYGIQIEHWLEVNHKLIPLKVVIQDLKSQKMYILEDQTAVLKSAQERIEIQQQLSHSAKLISLGTMAAGLAHEVNNPLAIIMGYAQMLKSHSSSPEKIVEQSEKIVVQTKRISKIINDLRIFSRNDKNTEDEGINIFSVLNDSLMYLNDHFHRNNIKFEINIRDEFILKGRTIEFQSVMQNLLSNSRDAFDDNPEILNKTITLDAEIKNGYVNLFYTDNAGGIKPEVIDKIFDPFFTTKEPGRGTGLGMSIMRTLIEVNDGQIKATSHYGYYTQFVIKWPLLCVISVDQAS